jgi:hypothetical protein
LGECTNEQIGNYDEQRTRQQEERQKETSFNCKRKEGGEKVEEVRDQCIRKLEHMGHPKAAVAFFASSVEM